MCICLVQSTEQRDLKVWLPTVLQHLKIDTAIETSIQQSSWAPDGNNANRIQYFCVCMNECGPICVCFTSVSGSILHCTSISICRHIRDPLYAVRMIMWSHGEIFMCVAINILFACLGKNPRIPLCPVRNHRRDEPIRRDWGLQLRSRGIRYS